MHGMPAVMGGSVMPAPLDEDRAALTSINYFAAPRPVAKFRMQTESDRLAVTARRIWNAARLNSCFTPPAHNGSMLHVLGCITEQHDLRLVLLAAFLCLFASIAAMTMIARGRAAIGNVRTVWLLAAGVAAGCGIWGLHFVAMLGYRARLPVSYDAPLTGLSILIAVCLLCIGLLGQPHPRRKTPSEAPLSESRSARCITSEWQPSGCPRSPTGTHPMLSHLLSLACSQAHSRFWWRWAGAQLKGYALAAGLFAFAIVGMHFTAMSAVVFVPDPHRAILRAVIAPGAVAAAVSASVILIMGLGMIGATVDHHLAHRAMGEAARLRSHIDELETTKRQLESATSSLKNALAAADAANAAKSRFLAQ